MQSANPALNPELRHIQNKLHVFFSNKNQENFAKAQLKMRLNEAISEMGGRFTAMARVARLAGH